MKKTILEIFSLLLVLFGTVIIIIFIDGLNQLESMGDAMLSFSNSNVSLFLVMFGTIILLIGTKIS